MEKIDSKSIELSKFLEFQKLSIKQKEIRINERIDRMKE